MRAEFPFAVARVTRRWRKLLDERLKDLGVTQRELAKLMAIENPTLVRLLDSLEQQDLIERRPCPRDRRARRLYLTPDGTSFMNILNERAAELREQMLAGLSDKEISDTVEVFHRILDNAERQQ